ncbi:MAG: ATP-binding protein [Pseudomonadota bacterium]
MDERDEFAWVNAVPLALLLVNGRSQVIALNPLASELFGTDQAGGHVVTVIRQPDVLSAITTCVDQQRPREARLSIRDHVHETLYRVLCQPAPYLDGVGAVVTFEDVTVEATAGQMRRDFVANVSHELRTPLTSLQGFIETLQGPARGDLNAADRFLATMSKEAERMNRLVTDLLSLSQVESEERVRPTERVELVGMLQSVARSLEPTAKSADMTIEIKSPKPEVWLPGDEDQLMQVFTNLAENGLKYGSDGDRVDLNVIEIHRDPILGQAAVKVDVQDHGQGFDEMHVPRLTERFYRLDDHRSRALGGTGLGLAIVKHIVGGVKGRMRIQSKVGVGSCFSVILPKT